MPLNEKHTHTKMIVWQSIDQLDCIVQDVLKFIPQYEYQTRKQIDTASDSVGANFVEGYYSGSIKEYLRFLHYGKRSCAEVHERVRRLVRKKFITEQLFLHFEDRYLKTMYLFDRLILSLRLKLENDPPKPPIKNNPV